MASRLNEKQIDIAFNLHERRNFVMLPLKYKAPMVSGWQKFKTSCDDLAVWERATGFGIQTGKHSGVTVIDVDKPDREFFEKFVAHHGLPLTTTVETPSGGKHLYYKFHAGLHQTQGFAGMANIDIRNIGGQVVAPGSPYDTKSEEKKKFIGINYEFARDENGKLLDFDRMIELDHFWIMVQERGVNRETLEVNPPGPPPPAPPPAPIA